MDVTASISLIGTIALAIALISCAASIVLIVFAFSSERFGEGKHQMRLRKLGRIASLVSFAALTACCLILVWCFMSGDVLLDYVVKNSSDSTGDLAWLFKLSGLWAGRSGSLLFWAWLISLFDALVIFASRKDAQRIDDGALGVSQCVLLAFLAVLMFSGSNMPFALLDPQYLTEDGALNQMGEALGMNSLLEHWAMAIHPPTLFIGYAGFTIPFAYAIAAVIFNDDSDAWVRRSSPFLLFSWLFLGLGIGLGAVWAYVVLGWGGYWGWDPVENSSLLPWLIGVALIHSFSVYKKRGQFKRWSVMCACLAFSFVVLGTFITRSGLVESVHAFTGDPVSLVLFLVLIVASILAGAIGLIFRRKSFGVVERDELDEGSLLSRDAAFYLNNLMMVMFAVILAYMTLSSALPPFLPLGGMSLSAASYDAVARPLGLLYCALIAICPMLGWKRTLGKEFAKRAMAPGICALALFAVLIFYYVTYLEPSYRAMLDSGTPAASQLLEHGSPLYYGALSVIGFLVASLLMFNSAFMLIRTVKASGATVWSKVPKMSGAICHAAVGIILIGLIGSSMYVTEVTGTLAYDEESDSAESTFKIQGYDLIYKHRDIIDEGGDVLYQVTFDVERDGSYVGTVQPGVMVSKTTQQQKLEAGVLGFPTEDLFVVFQGLDQDGSFNMDVRVNPLISVVWAGFAILMIGAFLSLFSKRDGNGVR